LVDLHLAKNTVYNHVGNVRQFLEKVREPIESLAVEDVRSYLLLFRNKNPYH
jgi:hypothetical protein